MPYKTAGRSRGRPRGSHHYDDGSLLRLMDHLITSGRFPTGGRLSGAYRASRMVVDMLPGAKAWPESKRNATAERLRRYWNRSEWREAERRREYAAARPRGGYLAGDPEPLPSWFWSPPPMMRMARAPELPDLADDHPEAQASAEARKRQAFEHARRLLGERVARELFRRRLAKR